RAMERIHIVPQRGNFARGILSDIYQDSPLGEEEAYALYESYYDTHPYTHVSKTNIDLKQDVNTNKNYLNLEKHGSNLFIVSIVDNLLKGASGQAVQNMNLMSGLEETAGLKLKSVGF